jgi:hypothetical protein
LASVAAPQEHHHQKDPKIYQKPNIRILLSLLVILLVALLRIIEVYQQEKCFQHHASICQSYKEIWDKGTQKD